MIENAWTYVNVQVKEDPDKWEELKRAETDYEKRRFTLCTYYEAVRHAQQVQVPNSTLLLTFKPIIRNQSGQIFVRWMQTDSALELLFSYARPRRF